MENPVKDIIPIIHSLTTDPPSQQQSTLTTYFTPTASFTHPFCRTGSFDSSRWFIGQIYQWYKILSPRIEIVIDSVAFDQSQEVLYVGIRQNFRLWFVPGYCADVKLVTVLGLTSDPYPHVHEQTTTKLQKGDTTTTTVSSRGNKEDISRKSKIQALQLQNNSIPSSSSSSSSSSTAEPNNKRKYWIQSQNDLYQTNEFIKFLVPYGLGWRLMVAWQLFATLMCVLGALILSPFTLVLRNVFGGNAERIRK